ncbi:MAG: hypothetical protein ACFFDJ_00740 [Candidatus Odinarchaeota archaeon]
MWKGKGERRLTSRVDSPCLPEGDILFTILASGIADIKLVS